MALIEAAHIKGALRDKRYDAGGIARYMRTFVRSGVTAYGENLKVSTANGKLYIACGEAYVDGFLFRIRNNEAGDYAMGLPERDGAYRVVLRKQAGVAGGVMPAIKAGEDGILPRLERTATCYEISLARLEIAGGRATLSDEREEEPLCGLARVSMTNRGLEEIYPVGSIYLTVNTENPRVYFGGMWERIGAGRTLVGFDAGQAEFNDVGKVGGEKVHTLTINEMPAHNHDIMIRSSFSQAGTNQDVVYTNGTKSSSALSFQTGGNMPHNNLQPYLVVNMWKRIG